MFVVGAANLLKILDTPVPVCVSLLLNWIAAEEKTKRAKKNK